MTWKAAAVTDRGLVRPANEDAMLCLPEHGLFAVADGMGGHAAGEVASAVALETIITELDAPGRPGAIEPARLEAAVLAADRAVRERAEREPDKAGMGTTLTVLALSDDAGTIAHVGDSRAYRLRQGRLEQLTSDHTWVQEQVDRGALSPESARRHPYASMLTRAIGAEPPDVEVLALDTRPEDLFLLCSDGLSGPVPDDVIAGILAGNAELESMGVSLVDEANGRGGPDNITVILVRVVSSRSPGIH